MSAIPDFNDGELWVVKTTLKERYGYNVEVQLADSELRLSPDDRELTECPTLFWQDDKVSFVVFKIAPERYRCQFFYSIREQYGTGIEEFDNIGECVTALLQVQADHEIKKNLETS
jgi:hypothetical protein